MTGGRLAAGPGRCLIRMLLSWLAVCFISVPAAADDWSALKQRLQADGFDSATVEGLYRHPELRFDPEPMAVKITTLMQRPPRQHAGKGCGSSRAVYRGYLRPGAIRSARAYLKENKRLLARVNQEYCVPAEVLVSIMLIETNLGANTGKRRALNVLSSMAAASDLDRIKPFLGAGAVHAGNEEQARQHCREKSAWAYNELKHLLNYSRSSGVDPLSIPGSIYGAIGLCQFMPSNIDRFGIDGDGNGGVDLFSKPDALFSIGNYLHRHGWKCGTARQQRRQIVMTYNNSQIYANTVLAVADRLRTMERKRN